MSPSREIIALAGKFDCGAVLARVQALRSGCDGSHAVTQARITLHLLDKYIPLPHLVVSFPTPQLGPSRDEDLVVIEFGKVLKALLSNPSMLRLIGPCVRQTGHN